MAIVALFIGILGVTLGFASFSNILKINSRASVSPNKDSFKVVFSSKEDEVKDGALLAKSGNGDSATIDNSGDVPKITNIAARFARPGDKVVYELYAKNIGDVDAILNMVEYTKVSGQTTKKYCHGDDLNSSLLNAACEDIRVTVKVADEDTACDTSTYGTHTLDSKATEKIVVEIEYATDGTRVDGPFIVDFGDIEMTYSTVQSGTKNIATCASIIRPTYSVTYTNMESTGLPVSVISGKTLKVDFDTPPEAIEVQIDGIKTTNYTYNAGRLTIPNVGGNVEIIKKSLHNVTYTNITGSSLPASVADGDTLTASFSAVGDELEVKVNNVATTNYTYSSGVLTVPNVTGNVIVTKKNAYSVTYTDVTGSNLPNRVVAGNTLTANFSTAPGAVKVLIGGVATTNYTLSGTTLTVPNVTGNVEVMKINVFSVTYNRVNGSSMPNTVEEGGTLEADVYSIYGCFGQTVNVSVNGVATTDFTYEENHLTVPNVTGNVIVSGTGWCY